MIERDHIVRDSYGQFLTIDGFDFHKEIKVHFVGEKVPDPGAVFGEWVT